MIFLAATDLHLSSKPPASRIDADYPAETFELLDQLAQAARAVKARAILFPGDVFHDTTHLRMDWVTLARFMGWCEALHAAQIDVVATVGNHDLRFNRYDSLPNTPLGLLFEAGYLRNCSDTYVSYSNTEIISVEGVAYPHAFDLDAWRTQGIDGATSRIVLGHCFAAAQRGDYFGEPVHSYQDLLDVSGADYVVLGHDHTDRGVLRFEGPNGPRYVLDVGAMTRLNLSDNDIGRMPKFSVIDTMARTVKTYSFTYRPASVIFDLERREEAAAEAAQVASFVDRLKEDLAAQQSGTSVEDKLAAMSLSGEVRTRVLTYIAEAEQAQQEALK